MLAKPSSRRELRDPGNTDDVDEPVGARRPSSDADADAEWRP